MWCYNYENCFVGSGELLDDSLRHSGHDIFWCYSFEREVSNVINIPSNQVNSEVTYNNYFSRNWFTKIYKWMVMAYFQDVGLLYRYINIFSPQLMHNEVSSYVQVWYVNNGMHHVLIYRYTFSRCCKSTLEAHTDNETCEPKVVAHIRVYH